MGQALSGAMGSQPESLSKNDLTFISPSEQLDMECPVCLHVILSDPYLVSCCGHHFCGYCIQQARRRSNACPLCKSEGYDLMLDKGLQRSIRTLKVKCVMHNDGCLWQGELCTLLEHINTTTRQGECQYAVVDCKNQCGLKDHRHKLDFHETNTCVKRVVSCEYCSHKSTYDIISTTHTDTCPMYPIPCPKQCSEMLILPRKEMKKHMDKDCPLAEIECKYSWAGCKWNGMRWECQEHQIQEAEFHLDMLCDTAKQLEQDNKRLKQEVETLKTLMKRSASELREQSIELDVLKAEVRMIKNANRTLK